MMCSAVATSISGCGVCIVCCVVCDNSVTNYAAMVHIPQPEILVATTPHII